MTGAEAHGYVLKFRCVYCRMHEVSVGYPCEGVVLWTKSRRETMEAGAKHRLERQGLSDFAVQIYFCLDLKLRREGKKNEVFSRPLYMSGTDMTHSLT